MSGNGISPVNPDELFSEEVLDFLSIRIFETSIRFNSINVKRDFQRGNSIKMNTMFGNDSCMTMVNPNQNFKEIKLLSSLDR